VLSYLERPPSPALKPYLECLWAVWDPRARLRREPDRIVPDGCPELIVHLADRFTRRVGRRWSRQPRVFLAGTLTRPWTIRAGRRVCSLGFRFRPGAVTALFDVTMTAATDNEVELAGLAGRTAARTLLRRLQAAPSLDEKLASADCWLAEQRRQPTRSVARRLARRAVGLILDTRGQGRIDDVAHTLGLSRRQLERAFLQALGIGPKLYARIARLNAVLATLDDGERGGAVDLALEAGYFDQPHLLRDFRALAGRPPGRGRDADGELARHFTHPERLRALFRGE